MLLLVNHILIKKKEDNSLVIDGKTYSSFTIVDSVGNEIGVHDTLRMIGDMRLDIVDGEFRIYPVYWKAHLYYDEISHTVYSEMSTEKSKHKAGKHKCSLK